MDPPPPSHRSILTIDLNETPPPQTSFPETLYNLSPTSLVRHIHSNPQLPTLPAATLPPNPSPTCSSCHTDLLPSPHSLLICDGCDGTFHFPSCAPVSAISPSLIPLLDEWLCPSCSLPSLRWPLGRRNNVVKQQSGGIRFLDINAAPPSDPDHPDILTATAATISRKGSFSDNLFGGETSGRPLPFPNFVYSSNGFDFQKPPGIVTQTVKQEILQHRQSTARSFEDIAYNSQLGKIRSTKTTSKFLPWNPNEVLQSLKEFISERHGILEEGWSVEFKQSMNGCEFYAVYRSPDGKTFETMSDVACYLGLISNGNYMEAEMRCEDGSVLRQNGLHLPKRRKLSKLPIENGFAEDKDRLMGGHTNGALSNGRREQALLAKRGKSFEVIAAVQEENEANNFHPNDEGLPLQYEDFFILSLGKVDARPSYHDTNQIWPVGYRSCWHDKVTGSLFLCDVLDGGDSGPVFKVRRFSCSALPVPYGSTVLSRRSCAQSECADNEGDRVSVREEDYSIETILADFNLPEEGDAVSCLLGSRTEVDGQEAKHSQPELQSSHEMSQGSFCVGDKIGELSVDGDSMSSVWSLLSQKLADECLEVYKQTGSLNFCCKHMGNGVPSSFEALNKKTNIFSPLDKFCSSFGSFKVPPVVQGNEELNSALEDLKSWVNPNRFGLDTGFVQELMEQRVEVHKCYQYESLRRRNDHWRIPLVGNGLLLINGESIEHCEQDIVLNGLYRDYKIRKESSLCNYSRPPGKQLGAKLSPHLVGDVIQVWQLLCRFLEVLSLKPLKFDELEAELNRPWFESLSQEESCQRDAPGGQISCDGSRNNSEQTLFSVSEGMENAAVRAEAQSRLALSSISKCACMSLKRAHMSLLDVLVSELQIKVAAVIDPSIDGESKSRRGRRRDVDSSILAIRTKLNLLPMNHFTWPELAHRYILAVLAMDGNLDFAESGPRECAKVFRCLQGDGGVLCGAVVGVAGIEADAQLLADAMKRVYGSLNCENTILTIEEDEPEPVSTSGTTALNNGEPPEWAQVLEPVRKLPTNVGTRIRRCVYEALEKDPPDWARKILEHSISKGVYKGNASGPTKKAVLSVLADVLSEGSQLKMCKEKEKKKKTMVSMSDIITKQCRILLRHAASADEDKIFCNLVGRNLMNSSDTDEEGLLGSPAMVSRTLDFRTIDLRLAVGAYGGSHEAFLEDVRELWNNIRTAHVEQPELAELAETLSQKFETLYEEEVIAMVQKFMEYSQMEEMSAEAKQEIRDILTSTSKIPKAPWDEGVCKTCGIDKDDDSVLLCDTCDAEYHTYCLNPPLARIPDGNWYCPSCVSGVRMFDGSLKGVQNIGQRHRRRRHGEGLRNHLEELVKLASVMENKDYWEFSVDERVLLLKFLCDEVLNSIMVRQHIEQCSELSSDMQQKLRLLYSEWKNIKLREDVLASRAAKFGLNIPNAQGELNVGGRFSSVANSTICAGTQHAVPENCDHGSPISIDVPPAKVDVCNQIVSQTLNHLEKNASCESEAKPSVELDCQMDDISGNEDTASPENHDLHEQPFKRRKSSVSHEPCVSNSLPHETSGTDCESLCQDKFSGQCGMDISAVSKSEDLQGVSASFDQGHSVTTVDNIPALSNESQMCNEELLAVQKEIVSLQQSISSAELQLLKSSVRMEYLGSDSCGRLYWVSSLPGEPIRVIVDCSLTLQYKAQGLGTSKLGMGGSFSNIVAPCITDSHLSLGGSSSTCPFVYGQDCLSPSCSQWISYESDAEVRELVKSLSDVEPKERELKDSILHWQKLRFHEALQIGEPDQNLAVSSAFTEETEAAVLTKASAVLEHKYGAFSQLDNKDYLENQEKRLRVTDNEKLCRCECLEPIWSSRHHCFLCHLSFFTQEDLDQHNSGDCKPSSSEPGKRKRTDEPSSGKPRARKPEKQLPLVVGSEPRTMRAEIKRLTSRPISDLMCPYRFEEICSRFVTNDSIKELVHGVGLIGSEGTPSLIPFVSPYLGDPTLIVHPEKDAVVAASQLQDPETVVENGNQVPSVGNVGDAAEVCSKNIPPKKQEHSNPDQSLLDVHGGKFVESLSSASSTFDSYSIVPECSLRPLVGRAAQILRHLKISLLDMEAALPNDALRMWKVSAKRRRSWHSFVKAAQTIYEIVQATIILEDWIKSEYLKNEWWYWSSLSAAAKISTLSSLALRIYALDGAIDYEKTGPVLNRSDSLRSNGEVDLQSLSNLDPTENCRVTRRSSKRKKDTES